MGAVRGIIYKTRGAPVSQLSERVRAPNMGASLLVVILMAALSASANNISGQCQVHNGERITCNCIGNEDFILPDDYNYTNVTSLIVTKCATVNLHYSSLPEASKIEKVVVQNVSNLLDFNVYITSKRIKMLKLSGIAWIPLIACYTFTNVEKIETLIIENTHIGEIDEDFGDVHVMNFILKNVTVDRVGFLNLAIGKQVYIRDSEFRNVALYLTFKKINSIEIIDSKFGLRKPGLVSILGDLVIIKNSVFLNASMSLTAELARIYGICADGKSTLRLSSSNIESIGNRLPNEIIYITQNTSPNSFKNESNMVCKAGNCKCPKISGQATCFAPHVFLLLLLPLLGCLSSMFRGLSLQ